MQTSQVEHSGAPGKVAASVERTAASGTTPGHNTTERSSAADVAALGSATPEGEFQAGVLNLDVTPPLNASRSYYGASGARQTMSTDAVSTMRRTPSPTQVQHSDPSTAISQQKQQYQAPPSRSVLSPAFSHNALPVERRQLFFGTGGTAGEELGGTYEAQLRGGESEANALPNGTSFSHQHYNGTASAAVDQDEASAGQRTRFGQEKMVMLRDVNSNIWGVLVTTGYLCCADFSTYSTTSGSVVPSRGVKVGSICTRNVTAKQGTSTLRWCCV